MDLREPVVQTVRQDQEQVSSKANAVSKCNYCQKNFCQFVFLQLSFSQSQLSNKPKQHILTSLKLILFLLHYNQQQQTITTTGGGDGSEGGDVDAEYGVGDEHEQVLDLPPSWVSKLAVERERYRLKYSTIGSNVKLYKRCKVELYAGKYSKAKESVHRVYGKALQLTFLFLLPSFKPVSMSLSRSPLF